MPHLVSEAFDYNDLFWQSRALILNFPTPVVSDSEDPTILPETIDNTIGGGAVGAGRVYIAALSSRAVLEQITLTCTTGGGDGVAVFSVSGATTGAFTTANLTAGGRYVSNDVLIIVRTTTNWSSAGNADRIRFTLEVGRFTAKNTASEACTFTATTDLIERDDNENWTDHGYSTGGGILIADAVDTGNNGFHLIESIATDALTIDDVHSTIADETSDTVTIIPYNARAVEVGLVVDFAATGDEIFLQGTGDGWSDIHLAEGDYIRIENAATAGHNNFWKVIRVFTDSGGTNRDTIQLESGAITVSDTSDTIDVTVYFVPERWCEDRFREGANEVSMTAPPTEDGNGDFTTTWELHGMGVSGTEAIYVSIITIFSNTLAYFNATFHGADSFLRTNTHGTHPNSSTKPVWILMNRSNMQFYLSANGDAIWGFIKAAGSIDEPFYLGLIKRHGTVLQLPYPLYIGGAASKADDGATIIDDSNVTENHRAWWDANMDVIFGGAPDEEGVQGWFQRKDGTWALTANGVGPSHGFPDNDYDGINPNAVNWTPYQTFDTALTSSLNTGGFRAWAQAVRSGFGDTYQLTPIELHSQETNHWGEAHGMFHISGQGDGSNATENWVVVDGLRHVVMQNTFRSSRNSYACMRLEA